MAEKTPSKFQIVQSYGGMKEAYFEVEDVTAADTIDFSENISTDVKVCVMQKMDGTLVPGIVCSTDDTVTVGTGPSTEFVYGTVKYASY